MRSAEVSIYWSLLAFSCAFLLIVFARLLKWRLPSARVLLLQRALKRVMDNVGSLSARVLMYMGLMANSTLALAAFAVAVAAFVPMIWEAQTAMLCQNGGTIDVVYKQCSCPLAWYDDGIDCTRSQVNPVRGYIVHDDTVAHGSRLVCNDKYHGHLCTECHANQSTGGIGCNGDCDPNYYREKCNYFCSRSVTCSGHGSCTQSMGYCECDSGYWGRDCSQKCPKSANADVCSGHGVCVQCTNNECTRDAGTCNCESPYVGSSCYVNNKCVNGVPEEIPMVVQAVDIECKTCNGGFICENGQSPDFSICRNKGTCLKCPDGCPSCRLRDPNIVSNYQTCCNADCNYADGTENMCPQSPTCDFIGHDGCFEDTCINGQCSSKQGFCDCFGNSQGGYYNSEIVDYDGKRRGCVSCLAGYIPDLQLNGDQPSNEELACKYHCTDETTCKGRGVCNGAMSCCNGVGNCGSLLTTCKICNCGDQYGGDVCEDCSSTYTGATRDVCNVPCEDGFYNDGTPFPGTCNFPRGRCLTYTDNVTTIDPTAPCICVSPDHDATGYSEESNCTNHCSTDQTKEQCNGHGTCRGGSCECDTDYHGMQCEFTADKENQQFWYKNELGDVVSQRCSGQAVVASVQYSHDEREYNTQPCSAITQVLDCCGGDCANETIFCDLRVSKVSMIDGATSTDGTFDPQFHTGTMSDTTVDGVCKRVECDCTEASLGGPGCQIQGCAQHTWYYAISSSRTASKTSVCGHEPPFGTNMHCARGECVAGNNLGMSKENPAQSKESKPIGECRCYKAAKTSCKRIHWGTPSYSQECCGKADSFYLGQSCNDRCLCDDPYFGTCGSDYLVAGAACSCRRGYLENAALSQNLFTGPTCSGICPGIVNADLMTSVNVMSDTSLCPEFDDRSSPLSPGCFDNLVPCNNRGDCADYECQCYGLSSIFVNGLRSQCDALHGDTSLSDCTFLLQLTSSSGHDIFKLATGDACQDACPYDVTSDAMQKTVDFYRTNRHKFMVVYRPSSQRVQFLDQLTTTLEYVHLYKRAVCSGHGACGSSATCKCQSDYGGDDCSMTCPVASGMREYFANNTLSDDMLERLRVMFNVGRCGVHSKCVANSTHVECACNAGGQFSEANTSDTLQHLMKICQLTDTEDCNTAVDSLMSVYGFAFSGMCSDCKPGAFTASPATIDYGDDIPLPVAWQLTRTCDGQAENICCKPNKTMTDWEAFSTFGNNHYGGCIACMGLATGKYCDQCRYGLVFDPSADCENKCQLCPDDGSVHYNGTLQDETQPHIANCSQCLRGANGKICSGNGVCVGDNSTYAGTASSDLFVSVEPNDPYAFTTCRCTGSYHGPTCAFDANDDTLGVCDDTAAACHGQGECIDGSCRCFMAGLDSRKFCGEYFDSVETERKWRVCMCMHKNSGMDFAGASAHCEKPEQVDQIDWHSMCSLAVTVTR